MDQSKNNFKKNMMFSFDLMASHGFGFRKEGNVWFNFRIRNSINSRIRNQNEFLDFTMVISSINISSIKGQLSLIFTGSSGLRFSQMERLER